MNAALEGLFLRTMRMLLRAYPPSFRARFGSEMMQVYSACILQVSREAGGRGLARLWLCMVWDGTFNVLAQWGNHWFDQITQARMAKMNLNPVYPKNVTAPLPVGQAFLAVLPFLLFATANVAIHLNLVIYHEGYAPLGLMMITHPYLVFNWLILIGLALGILRGLPRWAYTYVGWAILNTLGFANMSFYGQIMNFMWIPLALVIALPLYARWRRGAHKHPTKLEVPGTWRDLTLLLLAVYIFYTAVYMTYDENHHPALLWFIAASGLAASLGAWGFFRTASPLRQALSLLGGLALVIALEIWNSLTWDAGSYYGLVGYSPIKGIVIGLIFFMVMAAIMLGIGGLAEWVSKRKTLPDRD